MANCRARNQRWEAKQIINGLCEKCNRPISKDSLRLCDYHMEKHRQYVATTHQRYREAGKCWTHGITLEPEIDGGDTIHCSICREILNNRRAAGCRS